MLIPLLSLALAFSPTPARAAADVLGAARRGEIQSMASEWTTYRNRANRMLTAFPEGGAREGYDRVHLISESGKLRVLAAQIENVEAATADIAVEAIRASEPPSAARTERENAAVLIYQVQALSIYGNFVPRVLDAAIQDRSGRDQGRRWCGPDWAIVITAAEAAAYCRWLIARAGFTLEEYDAFFKQASTQVGYAPSQS